MTIATHALDTTKKEIEEGYRNLTRNLLIGQPAYAVIAAVALAKHDAAEFWKFLKNYAVTEHNYRDTAHLVLVDIMHNSWLQDPGNMVFVAQAVATLAGLTKMRSESASKFLK